jgi:hypothetical protein
MPKTTWGDINRKGEGIMEKDNVIELNTITYKAIQYFGDPPMMQIFRKLKAKQADNYKTLILMKKVGDALSKEGRIVDEVIKEIRERFGDGDFDSSIIDVEFDKAALNAEINKYLNEHEINIPLPKLKLSQIEGIETVGDLETFEGIIEVDITE